RAALRRRRHDRRRRQGLAAPLEGLIFGASASHSASALVLRLDGDHSLGFISAQFGVGGRCTMPLGYRLIGTLAICLVAGVSCIVEALAQSSASSPASMTLCASRDI